jgi:hypothetical protein
MGASPDDFTFVVQDVLEEYREAQLEFADMHTMPNGSGRENSMLTQIGTRI